MFTSEEEGIKALQEQRNVKMLGSAACTEFHEKHLRHFFKKKVNDCATQKKTTTIMEAKSSQSCVTLSQIKKLCFVL